MGPLNLCGAFHLLSSIYAGGCVCLISVYKLCKACMQAQSVLRRACMLRKPVVNTYRTYFGVEPETVSLLSFSQISCSPEIRKLSVKRSPPPRGTHLASSHLLSSLFVFVCLFLLFVSGPARQEELPLLPSSCNDAE